MKKALLVGGSSLMAGAIAGTATGSIAPAVLAASGSALVTTAIAEVLTESKTVSLENCEGAIIQAPDTLWTVAAKFVELGGIGLILAFVVVPLLVGWITPGPTRLNRK